MALTVAQPPYFVDSPKLGRAAVKIENLKWTAYQETKSCE